MSTMLVTGGTGAIGPELVGRLAAEPVADRIVVLTRTPEGARQRSLLESWNRSAKVPVAFLSGDLGSLATSAQQLTGDITHIAHLAGDTRFSAPLEKARATNVEGAAAVLHLARRCPSLSAVAVVSTVYVAGLRTGTVLEVELEHEVGFANAYERSKHEMEQLTRGAMRDLPLSVCRLSTVIGTEGSGAVPALNAFHTAMQMLYAGLIPMVPGAGDTPIDIISTGFAARGIQHILTEGFEPGATYHLCGGAKAPQLGHVIGAAMATMRARRPQWRKRAIEMPVLADEVTYALFVRSVEESGHAAMIASTRALESFARQLTRPKLFDTTMADAALGGVVACPDPLDLCGDVIRYCVDNQWKEAA